MLSPHPTARCDAPLASRAVPQANDIDKIRRVVAVVGDGADTTQAIADATGFSPRHVEYRVRAALLLGLLAKTSRGHELSAEGRSLLSTSQAGERERAMLHRAALRSPAVARVAPDLFAPVAPSRETLAKRIQGETRLAASTALRRAGTLLAWRRRLQSRQLSLFPHIA